MVHAGPLSHGSGSKVLMYFTRGARNVLIPKFDPEVFLRAVSEWGATSSFFVPTMIQMLVDHLDTHPLPQGLRNLSYGGASISRPTLETALDRLGPVLTQVYGSCEAPHPVTVLRHRDEVDPTMPQSELVPMGRPTMASEIRLSAPGEAPPDGAGELWIKGRNVMHGYWGKPEATARACWSTAGTAPATWCSPARTGYCLPRRPGQGPDHLGGPQRLPGRGGAGAARAPRGGRGVRGRRGRRPLGRGGGRRHRAATAAPRWTTRAIESWCAEHMAGYKKPRRIAIVDDLPEGVHRQGAQARGPQPARVEPADPDGR